MLTRGRMLYFAISRKSARATNPDARRRLSLLHGGASISMTPLFILIVVNLVLGRPAIENSSALFTFAVFLMLLGFPLTMAYVIVVERAMDVRVVIRQGVQYLLASRGVLFLQILLSAMVIFAAASLSIDGMNRPQRIRLMGGRSCLGRPYSGICKKDSHVDRSAILSGGLRCGADSQRSCE